MIKNVRKQSILNKIQNHYRRYSTNHNNCNNSGSNKMTKNLSLISELKKAKNNLYPQYQSYLILYSIIEQLETEPNLTTSE